MYLMMVSVVSRITAIPRIFHSVLSEVCSNSMANNFERFRCKRFDRTMCSRQGCNIVMRLNTTHAVCIIALKKKWLGIFAALAQTLDPRCWNEMLLNLLKIIDFYVCAEYPLWFCQIVNKYIRDFNENVWIWHANPVDEFSDSNVAGFCK